MKLPGTPLHHAGGNYLLVEGGYSHDTRTITLLAEPDNGPFEHPERARRITWGEQGEWYPISQWAVGMISLQEEAYGEQRALIDEIFERFRVEQRDLRPVAWAVQGHGGFLGSLETILPMGLAVTLYDDEETAAEESGADEVVPITNLPNFLTHLAREGYAGAMWNGRQPVFFCIDDADEVQFLRVQRSDAGGVAMEILDADGAWNGYEGAEQIEMLDNAERCDARLVETLGMQPVLDWPDHGTFYGVGPRGGHAGLVQLEEDGPEYAVLFVDEDAAGDWRDEVEPGWNVFEVEELSTFLGSEELEGRGALLNPGAHRARQGVLWSDGERVILDSFSGFWTLEDDEFEPVEE